MGIRSRPALPPTFLFPFHGEMSGERTKSRDRSSTRNPVWEQDARVLRSRTCEREIGALTFDFALNTYSGHVDVRINKKPGSLNLAIRGDPFASAGITSPRIDKHVRLWRFRQIFLIIIQLLFFLIKLLNYSYLFLDMSVWKNYGKASFEIVTETRISIHARFDVNRGNFFASRNSEFPTIDFLLVIDRH